MCHSFIYFTTNVVVCWLVATIDCIYRCVYGSMQQGLYCISLAIKKELGYLCRVGPALCSLTLGFRLASNVLLWQQLSRSTLWCSCCATVSSTANMSSVVGPLAANPEPFFLRSLRWEYTSTTLIHSCSDTCIATERTCQCLSDVKITSRLTIKMAETWIELPSTVFAAVSK